MTKKELQEAAKLDGTPCPGGYGCTCCSGGCDCGCRDECPVYLADLNRRLAPVRAAIAAATKRAEDAEDEACVLAGQVNELRAELAWCRDRLNASWEENNPDLPVPDWNVVYRATRDAEAGMAADAIYCVKEPLCS